MYLNDVTVNNKYNYVNHINNTYCIFFNKDQPLDFKQ